MTNYFSLSQLSEIIKTDSDIRVSELDLNISVLGITTDTRTIEPGEIFIALVGENFDGHDFVDLAIDKGAIAVVVSRQLETQAIPQFVVADTLQAYQQIARWWRDRLSNIPVISITGSVGKTSTKELVAAVLGTQGEVLKTEANFNNEIGVPKTLLQINSEHDYAVVEMAMRGAGEIALLTDIARPTIGIITNVGTAHIGRLGSRKAIAQAKCELLAQMPETSVAILNYDNPLLMETAKKVWQGKTITYGLTGGDIQGEIDGDVIEVLGYRLPLPLPGEHNASNYLAAIATARWLDIDLTTLKSGLNVELPKGRSRRYDLADDLTILDETYNAGLESMLAALQMLKDTPGKRHIAVLGTMKELGEYSAQLHRQVGEKAQELDIDLLLVLADEDATREIANGAAGINSECFSDRDTLINRLKQVIQPGDRILCKASNSVGLNKVVAELVAQLGNS
ncbi:MAG: UDP-N-acetylmuramoyl-tripeptide--D-alanyl-D-alanine ligase [Pleurocapsa sp. MO_226.B13]|nr:UDP-N-acetylmuramoyl-tripeptide--D-alanyl-D-alanine ligase [Pleurocapsa sp. MO_226.B13]